MKKDKFESYIDTSGDFSNKSLKQAEFYLKHKILFKKILVGILMAWCILSILFGLFFWSKYFLFDYQNDKVNVSNMVNTGISQSAIERNKPQDLQVANRYVFASSKDKYDFAVEVANPNKSWIANVVYHFVYENGQTEDKMVVLLPGDKRFLPEFGVESKDFIPVNIQFQLLAVSWQKIDVHKVSDPLNYITQRINFSVDNIKFDSFGSAGTDVCKILSFDVTNNTLFGFKSTGFVVVLRNNGEIVGFTPLYIANFGSLSSQNISFSLFNNTLEVDSVELEPVINVFDESIYL